MQIIVLLKQINIEISPEESLGSQRLCNINISICKCANLIRFFVNIHIKQRLNITHKKYTVSTVIQVETLQ